jgi:N-acetylmuramoyl-L-alanine amidase
MQPSTPTPLLATAESTPRRAVDLVVIHCSATPSGKSLSQGTPGTADYLNAPQVIDTWHAARGFKRAPEAVKALSSRLPHIGYHYVIDLTGEVWTGRGLEEIGAHARNFNAHSVGICLVGGAERDAQYTPAQWRSLGLVVPMLMAKYGIPLAAPKRVYGAQYLGGYSVFGGVCGHRDLAPDKSGDGLIESFEWLKTCPGFSVADWASTGMTPDPKNIYRIEDH